MRTRESIFSISYKRLEALAKLVISYILPPASTKNTQRGATMILHNKVALVTGGSRGIGRAICLGFAAQGAKVWVTARTEMDTSAGTEFAHYASGTIHIPSDYVVDQESSDV